jgi:hypothetical protein
MEKLPCSTSFLMSVNFDGLKEVIDFLHKNINILNEKINDLNIKFRGFEEVKHQLNENKLKTESSLRLLNELDDRISNFSQNMINISEKSNSNEQKINQLTTEFEKMQLYNSNLSDSLKDSASNDLLNKLFGNHKELKEEIENEKINNNENNYKLNQRLSLLEDKINKINTNMNTDINNNINNFNNVQIGGDDFNKINTNNEIKSDNIINDNKNNSYYEEQYKELKEEMDKKYELLSDRVDSIEQNVNKLNSKDNIKDDKDNYINENDIFPSNYTKPTVIKEIEVNAGNNNIDGDKNNSELREYLDKKIDEFSEKITQIEDDIRNIQLNTNNNNYNPNININIPFSGYEQRTNENNLNNDINTNKINNDENNKDYKDIKEKEENKNDTEKIEKPKEREVTDNSVNKSIAEIMSQINIINNKLAKNDSLKKSEFNKYTQRIDLQFKDYNDKINNIIQKNNLTNKLLEDFTRSSNNLLYKQKDENINKTEKQIPINNNYVTLDMFQAMEIKNKELIIRYISNIDISTNPTILEIQKNFDDLKNTVKDLSFKIEEIFVKNNKNNEYMNEIIDDVKKDSKINMRKLQNEIERITSLQEEIDFFSVFLLGKDEDLKYKNMSSEERKNELLIGTSIKEEINIHGNYLKKLSEGINKVNSRINNLNKETLVLIKKDLKSESNSILEDFKYGLKDSINRIESQLRDKVDKLGLDEFWNKINEQLISEMKEKIDKKEMNKNNQYLKRKIDNLESKISRTLVDTLIDLQMDEAPLVVKRNFREIKENKCASCGQNLPNINTGIMSTSSDFNSLGTNYKIFKPRNIGDKDKLPEIKQTLPK